MFKSSCSQKVLHIPLLSWHCSCFPCHIFLSAWRNFKGNKILIFKKFYAIMTESLIDWLFCILPHIHCVSTVPTEGFYWVQLSKANFPQAHLLFKPHPRNLFILRPRAKSVSAWVPRPPILQVIAFIMSLLSLRPLPQFQLKHSIITYSMTVPYLLAIQWLSPMVSNFYLLPACSLWNTKYNLGLAGISSSLTLSLLSTSGIIPSHLQRSNL